ncbi:MAG TPA: hypothetical protein VGB36_03705 [Gammaproteobacteria bacterium]|jgi:hypothetical protein
MLLAAAIAAVLVSGCTGFEIAEPDCGPAHPEDCVYLLKVRGAIPWHTGVD